MLLRSRSRLLSSLSSLSSSSELPSPSCSLRSRRSSSSRAMRREMRASSFLSLTYAFHSAYKRWANKNSLSTRCRYREERKTACVVIRFRWVILGGKVSRRIRRRRAVLVSTLVLALSNQDGMRVEAVRVSQTYFSSGSLLASSRLLESVHIIVLLIECKRRSLKKFLLRPFRGRLIFWYCQRWRRKDDRSCRNRC